jgi:hypothetical protein
VKIPIYRRRVIPLLILPRAHSFTKFPITTRLLTHSMISYGMLSIENLVDDKRG